MILLICNCSFAQVAPGNIKIADTLENLEGLTQRYFYSPGQESRAKSIAVFMEDAGKFFQNEVGFTPEATLYVLSPRHWKAIAAKPLQDVYGFPHNLDRGRLVIAAEDNDFWRSFLPPVDQLPVAMAKQVEQAYGYTQLQKIFTMLVVQR